MTNILQDGAAWLGRQLKAVAGVTVAYHRGSSSVSGITATVSQHEYEVLDTDGIMVLIKSRDYIVHAADLVLSGSSITPRSGDRIVETIGGVSQTFEIMPLGAQNEYEPLDTDGVLLRIHTKKVG